MHFLMPFPPSPRVLAKQAKLWGKGSSAAFAEPG